MNEKRTLKKIEAMCTDNTDVYECTGCMWLAYVPPSRTFQEVEMEFKVHNCNKNSISHILSGAAKA